MGKVVSKHEDERESKEVSSSHICLVGVLFTIRGQSLQELASITGMKCNGCNTVLHLETSAKVREVQQAVRDGSVTLQLFGAK